MRNLKKLLLLSCITLIAYTSANAQTTKYYATDGTTWVTQYDRDVKERLLWDKIDLNLRAALVNGGLGEDTGVKARFESLHKSFRKCISLFEVIRLEDSQYAKLQNGELRFFLEQNDVIIKNGEARNGEIFNVGEYATMFDAVLREYTFNADLVHKLADGAGHNYNLDMVVNEFAERMDLVDRRVEMEIEVVDFREKSIDDLYLRYEKNKQQAKLRESQQNRRKK